MRNKLFAIGIFLMSLSLIIFIIVFYIKLIPSNEKIELFDNNEHVIVHKGEILKHNAKIKENHIYLSYDFIKNYIDERAYVDEKTKSIILTTGDKIIRFSNSENESFVNDNPIELHFAAFKEDERYIPYKEIEPFYKVNLALSNKTGVILLTDYKNKIRYVEVTRKDNAAIRVKQDIKSPYLVKLNEGEKLELLETHKEWSFVQQSDGYFGYIKNEYISSSWSEAPKKEKEHVRIKMDKDKKINLVWEAIYNVPVNEDKIKEMRGVNVVSPTWFELKNGEGDVRSKVDSGYVKWAHENNYQVWGLFSNDFNPDITHEMLTDSNKRLKVIKQLLTYAKTSNLDGINIDFENVYLKDKKHLVQFVRELTTYLHREKLIVSIDVTIHSNSEMWSMFYDREAFAEVVDYVAVMTYDEHWAASPIAGSVASLPWVEKGIIGLLQEVPEEKLLLGIPFYTRVWTEVDGQVSSKTLSMKFTDEWIRKRSAKLVYDEATNQDYYEYDKDGKTYKVWFENEKSIKKRIELVHKYNLAGIAIWERRFADDEIWDVIDEELQRKEEN